MFPFPVQSLLLRCSSGTYFSILLCLRIYLSPLTEFRASKQMDFSVSFLLTSSEQPLSRLTSS
uniref:Putative ovule protein n=1 Tax=Solanum chacoense TaxID=4108 RepID=A0A0V0GKF9_SOLCH